MRKTLIAILFFLLFVTTVVAADFWASRNSNKYHYPNCKWAQAIKPSNLIKFNSPEDAAKAGYIPCKVCKPPTSLKSEFNVQGRFNLVSLQTNVMAEFRRGCCSWHGGVCGCDSSTGRVKCCDGTLSPTCTCW